jgi:hypothetical protein
MPPGYFFCSECAVPIGWPMATDSPTSTVGFT